MKLKVMSLVFAVIGFLFSLIFQFMASISDVVFGGNWLLLRSNYIFANASSITLFISRKQQEKGLFKLIILNEMTVIK